MTLKESVSSYKCGMGTCCGEKRDQIRNAERLPLSCLLKVIVLMIKGVDKATFRTWEKIEATGMAWKWLCIYLGS